MEIKHSAQHYRHCSHNHIGNRPHSCYFLLAVLLLINKCRFFSLNIVQICFQCLHIILIIMKFFQNHRHIFLIRRNILIHIFRNFCSVITVTFLILPEILYSSGIICQLSAVFLFGQFYSPDIFHIGIYRLIFFLCLGQPCRTFQDFITAVPDILHFFLSAMRNFFSSVMGHNRLFPFCFHGFWFFRLLKQFRLFI